MLPMSGTSEYHPGPLALVGGAEWQPGCDFDAELAARSGGEVLVLPTAAAYEDPARAVAKAEKWFGSLGASARGLMVLTRTDAGNPEAAEAVASARFIYLSGGSALHLKSVLKGSAVFEALLAAWRAGAVVAGSSAGAMVLTDPMVDPRGGAFTLGLGLVEGMAVVPHYDRHSEGQVHRTVTIAPPDLPIAGIDERTALIREPDGSWRTAGAGGVKVYLGGSEAGLDALP
jgi:cyanophycinase